MQKNIAVLFGDGVGPDVIQQSIKVLDAIARQFNHQFRYRFALIGNEAVEKTGNALPDETIETCLNSDAVLFGAIGQLKYNEVNSSHQPGQIILALRQKLGLFASIRPITTYAPLQHLSPLKNNRLENVDFVIYRELTGGIYFGLKRLNDNETQASDDCTYNRDEIERVAHLAFKSAQKRKKHLTMIDKANVLETSRLWRKVVQDIAKHYPEVTADYMFVDNAAMQIISNPAWFDVILTENLFGDIINDEASVISGSPGLLPSASIGNEVALFEPYNAGATKNWGSNIANPIGSILSVAMMLEYFNLKDEAMLVREAVQWTIVHGFITRDLDPINNYSTSTIGDLIMDYVEERIPSEINKENMVISKSTII